MSTRLLSNQRKAASQRVKERGGATPEMKASSTAFVETENQSPHVSSRPRVKNIYCHERLIAIAKPPSPNSM